MALDAPPPDTLEGLPVDAVGKVLLGSEKRFGCTGFIVRSREWFTSGRYREPSVVREAWVVTAGHCYEKDMWFQQAGDVARPMWLVGFTNSQSGWDVLLAVVYTGSYRPLRSALIPAWDMHPQVGDRVTLIGYGNRALLARTNEVVGFDERGYIIVDGWASKGNSGGPVILAGTRHVVGVGVEATCLIPGIGCLLAGSRPPYYATPIEHIQPLARWDE